jgi:quercetin dioxygenase-like cupin family protein
MDPTPPDARYIVKGADRFGEVRGMGISTLCFKIATEDSAGAFFLVEQTLHARGGPPRHLHPAQEELFYALEGDFIVEIGSDRFELRPGDTLWAPRQVPHVWAFVGEGVGRLLVGFSPAGRMETFFREVTKESSMPAQDPTLWRACGMEVVGPPLLGPPPARPAQT